MHLMIRVKKRLRKLLEHPHTTSSTLIVTAIVSVLAVFAYFVHLQNLQIQQLAQINQVTIQNQLHARDQLFQKITLASRQVSQKSMSFTPQTTVPLANQVKNTLNLEKLSESVCMIQGEYIFVDPKTNQPLRYHESYTARKIQSNTPTPFIQPAAGNNHAYPASTTANGPILQVHYTASGFLVDHLGHIVTNSHVTKPWETSDKYRHIIETGYQPKMVNFHAFFPKQKIPFDLDIIEASDENDLAIVKCQLGSASLNPLHLAENTQLPAMGDTVILLGYPTGLDLLMAQLPQNKINPTREGQVESYHQVAQNMARQNRITPTATRGMCGQITRGKIIYDAGTAHGASGCPVFDTKGNVIAINTAMITAFSGTNFGIPIQSALDMLNKIAQNL